MTTEISVMYGSEKVKALVFLWKPWRPKVFFQFGIIINIQVFPIHLLVDKMSDIRNEMGLLESKFANVWSKMQQIWGILIHLKLWFAVARQKFMWVKFKL